MRNFLFTTLIFVFISVLFSTCKKNDTNPSNCTMESFSFIEPFTVSSQNIDFQTENSDTISAKFSNQVDWTVSIKGISSGAERVYQGTSDSISIIWDGRPGQNKFYLTGEDVVISLSIPCNQNYSKTIHVKNCPNGSNHQALLISDFDGSGYVPNKTTIGYNSTGWSCYSSNPSKISKFQVISTPLTAPQGVNYLNLTVIQESAGDSLGDIEVNMSQLPNKNIDSIYFNAYINSGSSKSSEVIIILSSGPYHFSYTLPITWSGWNLVSIKLSDFKTFAGGQISNPSLIVLLDFILNRVNSGSEPNELNIDNIIFTMDGPLN